jgi:hypothetical protein
MKDKIDIGAIGTFGLPHGCTQSGFYNGKIKTRNKSLDLNANAIKIFPDTILYIIRREVLSNEPSIIFGKYSFAKERNSNRGGTFIGSFISFYNCFANSNQIYSLLKEFHSNLIENENNILNSILQVSHSSELQVKLPKDFEKINENLNSLNGTEYFSNAISQNQNFVVYSEVSTEDKIVKFFQNCLEFFPNNETIYFTQNKEIAEFVNEKRLLKIQTYNDFEKEIENIKIKKVEELKRIEALRIEEQRKIDEQRRLEEQKREEQRKIDEQKRKDQEEINRILKKKETPHHQLKLDLQKSIISDYNKLLDWYKDLEKKNDSLERTQNVTFENKNDHSPTNHSKEQRPNSNNKKLLFYIIIPIICISFLILNIYFIYFQKPKIEYISSPVEITNSNEEQIINLSPIPNSELSQSDKKLLFQNSIKGKKIGEIVNIIFENNPTEILKVYSYQKDLYQNNLYKLNEKHFKTGNDTICINDSISKVPSFKIKSN